ncbi:hypothetical protein TWF173_001418 [Orbilia oligospora]|nr:hypothetical protein TWF173_001418 [Orbilia oligospora]
MEPRKNYNKDEIYELTKACKGKFLHLLESGAPQEQHSCHEFIRKQYDSFRVWIATTGALAPSEVSLDHRLRDHGHILLAIVELLFLIQDCLKDEPCTIESDDQVDENSQIKTKDREVQNIVSQHGALNRALECLHQLASSIRRASVPNSQFDLSARLFKGTKLYDPNYLDYMKRLLKYRFPSAAESLIDQLATSMSRRQNLLLYKARHAQKLSQNRDHNITSAFTGSNSPQNIETASAKHATGVERSIQTETQLPLRKASLSFAYSNTEASRLLLNKATPRWRASSSITSTRAGVGLRNDQGVYPSIPTFSKDDEFCICPYCFQTLATKKLSPQWSGGKTGAGSSPQYWRNHYDDDIKPFVCISEACNDPLQFFSKFDSWEKHMVSQHSEDWPRTVHSIAWCCDIDDCRLDEKVFYQLKDFEEHLEGKPKRQFSANQITALAVRKQRTIRRELGTCPLCEVTINCLVSNLQNSPLADHIGGHLHYLASLCVTELDIVPDNADSESHSDRRKTKEDSQTDSKGQLLTEIERGELIFYDGNDIPDISSNAANTHYQSPEPAGLGRTVNRYYFMVQNYNPTNDLVAQSFLFKSRDKERSLFSRLTCPFGKGDPITYPACVFIMRRDLSGVKEHLRRNHFEGSLPTAIKTSKSWTDLFAYCNPGWQGIHPEPYSGAVILLLPGLAAETKRILVLSLGRIPSKPTENSGTTSPSVASLRPQPEDIIFGNSSDQTQTEYNQKKASFDPVTIVEGDAPFLDTLNRPQSLPLLFDRPQTQEVPQSSYNDIGSLAGELPEWRAWIPGHLNLVRMDLLCQAGQPDLSVSLANHRGDLVVVHEPFKVTEQETRKERYDIIVYRPLKGANSSSIEQPGPKIFTFNDFTEFRSGFEHWMKSEFIDPLFSWDEMLLFDPLQKKPLQSLEEVVDNIEQSSLMFRSFEVVLYLLGKDDTLTIHRLAL